MRQVGRLDGKGPEKQALSSSKMQTRCVSVSGTRLSSLATQTRKRNFHLGLARTF